MHQIVIPRTQRLTSRQCQPLDRDTFAAMLIEKLTAVKRNQEQQEFLERKLKEVKNRYNSYDDFQLLILFAFVHFLFLIFVG